MSRGRMAPGRERQACPAHRGGSLVELMATLGAVLLVLALAMPPVLAWARRQRLESATRRLAQAMMTARWQALSQGRHAGLLFVLGDNGSLAWRRCFDGDGDGILRQDLEQGVDFRHGVLQRLDDHAPGVRAGILPVAGGPPPRLPPLTGELESVHDPVKFGRSDVVSFSALGSATPGSIYLTDGRNMTAVVLNGVTGRLRRFRFDDASRAWKEMS